MTMTIRQVSVICFWKLLTLPLVLTSYVGDPLDAQSDHRVHVPTYDFTGNAPDVHERWQTKGSAKVRPYTQLEDMFTRSMRLMFAVNGLTLRANNVQNAIFKFQKTSGVSLKVWRARQEFNKR